MEEDKRAAIKQAWESPRGGVEPRSIGNDGGRTGKFSILEFYTSGVYHSPPRRPTRISIRRIIDEVYEYKGAYENPRFEPIEEPLGLVWKEEVGKETPFGKSATSTEIQNEALAAALQRRVDKMGREAATLVFSRTEWDDFKVQGISIESYIKVGNKYFRPVATIRKARKRTEQEGRAGQVILLCSAAILLICGGACAIVSWASESLLDDTTLGLCMNMTFRCLDTNGDGCLENSEYAPAMLCDGNCSELKATALAQIAAASSSRDGACSSGSASSQDYIAVFGGWNASARNRTDRIFNNSSVLRGDLNGLCRLDLKKQAGCVCLTTDAEDCNCANTDIGIIEAVWATVCLKLWLLGFLGATVFTGIPALVSGVRYIPCINTGCYSACASIFSVIFVIVGAVFLGLASMISASSSRWHKIFGIADCQVDVADIVQSFDYGYDVVEGYGYDNVPAPPPASASANDEEKFNTVDCSSEGYCQLLENLGVDLATRSFKLQPLEN